MNQCGRLLREWRTARRLSQLEVALRADISARHLSFLENGKSLPGKVTLNVLCSVLDVPLTDRHVLLQSAGYSSQQDQLDLDHPAMTPVASALRRLLESHEPYPASVLDANWNLLMSNRSHHRLLAWLGSQGGDMPATNNILELLFHPKGLRRHIANWEEVASVLLQRLYREQVLYARNGGDLLAKILQYPGIPADWKANCFAQDPRPVVSIELIVAGRQLALFSMLGSFGTAIDVTVNKLVTELFFPMDEATKDFFDNILPELPG